MRVCVCLNVTSFVAFGMVQAHLKSGASKLLLLLLIRLLLLLDLQNLGHVMSPLCVAFHVQGQVVRPGKAPVAVSALERFCARVLPVVARQFVAACETPLTALPRAFVWFFACMRSLVRLQVRTLRVDLLAAEELTLVYPPLRVGTVVVLSLVVFHCYRRAG